jgi:predicted DNA-binding transcriptional regulator AlpA
MGGCQLSLHSYIGCSSGSMHRGTRVEPMAAAGGAVLPRSCWSCSRQQTASPMVAQQRRRRSGQRSRPGHHTLQEHLDPTETDAKEWPLTTDCRPVRTGQTHKAHYMNSARLAYRVPEASALVGLSAREGWRRVAAGDWPSIKCGRVTLVPAAGIEEWLRRKLDERSPALQQSPSSRVLLRRIGRSE